MQGYGPDKRSVGYTAVASVDPDDDSITRYVVWHYRYDPDRNERRNVVVAAFDNPDEWQTEVRNRAADLRARRDRGEDVDPSEKISGVCHEQGHRQRWANGHLVDRAMKRGVAPFNIMELDLPFPVLQARQLPIGERATPNTPFFENDPSLKATRKYRQDRAPWSTPSDLVE